MGKIANKDAAREWHEEEARKVQVAKDIETEIELLRYAAVKRKTGYPSPHTLRSCGLVGAADLLTQAYNLIEEAYYKAKEEAGVE